MIVSGVGSGANSSVLSRGGKVSQEPFKAAKNQNYFSAALESSRMGDGLILEAIVQTSSETGLTGVTIRLAAGNQIHGPAVIEAPNTNILVHPEQRARLDPYLNVVIDL